MLIKAIGANAEKLAAINLDHVVSAVVGMDRGDTND